MVRRIQHGSELDVPLDVEGPAVGEEAEEGRLPVVGAEAPEEAGVGDEAEPPLADE